ALAAAAAIPVAAATAAEPAAVSTAASRFHRTGFIDRQRTTFMLGSVQFGNGFLCLGIRGHLDKAETLATTGVPIGNDFRRFDRAECCKHFREGSVVNRKR